METFKHALVRIVQPLRSRKVRVALATVLAAYAADFGLNVGEQTLLTILGVGVALILGIAHEDAGEKSRTVIRSEPLTELKTSGPVGVNGTNGQAGKSF